MKIIKSLNEYWMSVSPGTVVVPGRWYETGVNSRNYRQTDMPLPYSIDPLFEDNDDILYHATYKPVLDSILQYGIDPKRGKKNWEDSKDDLVYLATDRDVAISYAEISEEVPEEWLDQIVVLWIDTNQLDQEKLSTDKNVIGNKGETVEYSGYISPDCIIKIEEA